MFYIVFKFEGERYNGCSQILCKLGCEPFLNMLEMEEKDAMVDWVEFVSFW